MSTHVKRAFKCRFCPTDAQAAGLSRTSGCVRKVCGPALAARTQAWVTRQERATHHQTPAMLTAWKKTEEPAYLNEVSSVPLQQALRHVQAAFTHFFGRRAQMTGPLAVVWSGPLPGGMSPSAVALPQDAAGRWSVSLLCDGPGIKPLPENANAVSTGAGLEHLLTLSAGEKTASPRHKRRDRAAPARRQRRPAKKEKGPANRPRARPKAAEVRARIAGRRRDTLHKITTRLVRDNQTTVIEDPTVRSMVRNHRLARALSDAAWSEFRSMLEYKAPWYGREVIAVGAVGRWLPSSRLCCACGMTHDRDVNTAHSLLAAGLAARVCGAGARPQRSTPGRQSATKQNSSRREPRESPFFRNRKGRSQCHVRPLSGAGSSASLPAAPGPAGAGGVTASCAGPGGCGAATSGSR
nr:RNA-guided endonuclease TnpB family protein [Streptomyces mirabilis]